MWVYGLLLLLVFSLLIMASIYVIKLSHKISMKITDIKSLSWLLSFLPLLLLIIILMMDIANVSVIYLHLIIIVLIIKLVLKLIKKNLSEYVILTIGVIITSIILIYGYYQANHVVKTNYSLYTDKDIGTDFFRIVQISDSHIGTTLDGKEFLKYMEEINTLNPDIVVLTGDYIDDNTEYLDMIIASHGLGLLETKYGVYFVFGNHDKGYYSHDKEEKLREELANNNVTILEDETVNIGDNIILIGRQDRNVRNRVDAISLTEYLNKNKYLIMLDHEPNDYDEEEISGVDLVLSGHTHGGQLFPLGQLGLLLGANDKIYGMEKRGNTTFIVNSGISDWAIKFKTGTKSEYGVIDIISENKKIG